MIQAVNKFVHSNWFTSFSGPTNGTSSNEEKPKDKSSLANESDIDEIADEINE